MAVKGGIRMLSENIKAGRRAKGLSQEELANRLNVVRQTVSKWEQGLSVPDADMLISVSEVLEMPVSTLLGETVDEKEKNDEVKELAEKLEAINLLIAQKQTLRKKILHWLFIALCAVIAVGFIVLAVYKSRYLGWNTGDPETAVAEAAVHAAEWIFVRIAPLIFVGSAAGACLTRKKR